MSRDPYSPCVCGSGKKLKFCCLEILPDLQRIQKLIENQPEAAEKHLRTLFQKHSDKEVVVTQLASVLSARGGILEARELLTDFLRRHSDEPRSLLALAEISLLVDGFAASRRLVHRAFQLGAKAYPTTVGALAGIIAGEMARAGNYMAMREHLALSVRMLDGEPRKRMLMQLASFENQANIFYPFRGSFSLLPVTLEPELQKEELRARRVSLIGCWEPAAIIYTRLLEKNPQNGCLWYNLGLFRAWDGRAAEAARALHKAAELIDDYDTAVEAETLAQLIDIDHSDELYNTVRRTLRVKSLSEALSRLDDHPQLRRLPPSSTDDEKSVRPVAEYDVIAEMEGEAEDQLPLVTAELEVLDASDDDQTLPVVAIACQEEHIPVVFSMICEILGDVAQPDGEKVVDTVVSRHSKFCELFDWKFHQPPGVGSFEYRAKDALCLQKAIQEWLDEPNALLDNLSPVESAKDANNLIRVGASVLVLEAIASRMGHEAVTLAEIRSRLGIAAPSILEVDTDRSITSLPLLQYCRLSLEKLTDLQLIEFGNRMTLIRRMRLLDAALEEIVRRPTTSHHYQPQRIHMMRATIAREKNDLRKASECFAEARKAAEKDKDAFRYCLEIDISEFSSRLDKPDDPELKDLLNAIRERYFHKIPEIERVLREELENSAAPHLLELLDVPVIGQRKGGLWTPASAEAAAATRRKLWVPGQD